MSVVDSEISPTQEEHQDLNADAARPSALHRIREVRLQQGVSLRSAARQLGRDVRSLRDEENAFSDLRLSELHQWQQLLDVPIADLLQDSESPLSRPVLERARMVRLMKTAAAIHERTAEPTIKRMAQMLVEQLVEVMPELKDVSPWHNYGQRRSMDDFGQAADRRFSDDLLND